jgi:hypothetical protein
MEHTRMYECILQSHSGSSLTRDYSVVLESWYPLSRDVHHKQRSPNSISLVHYHTSIRYPLRSLPISSNSINLGRTRRIPSYRRLDVLSPCADTGEQSPSPRHIFGLISSYMTPRKCMYPSCRGGSRGRGCVLWH